MTSRGERRRSWRREPKGPKSSGGKALAGLGIAVSLVVLLNLTLGVFELPDALPVVGNLDEGAAAALLLVCLRYLGVDMLPFGRSRADQPPGKGR